MKQFYLGMTVMAGLVFGSAVFADTSKVNGYYSMQHPLSVSIGAKAALHPPTDIMIINASMNIIYAGVQDTNINDLVYPGNNTHIWNYLGSFYTTIILRNPYQNTFFVSTVCPFAVVSVLDVPGGAYRVNIDSEYCN